MKSHRSAKSNFQWSEVIHIWYVGSECENAFVQMLTVSLKKQGVVITTEVFS